jgi:hypothetical protein
MKNFLFENPKYERLMQGIDCRRNNEKKSNRRRWFPHLYFRVDVLLS